MALTRSKRRFDPSDAPKNIGKRHKPSNLLDTHRQSSDNHAITKDIFPFLQLPRELRDLIYNFALGYDGVQDCICKYNEVFPNAKATLQSPSSIKRYMQTPEIMLANHQLYDEARKVMDEKLLHISTPLLAADFGGNGLRVSSSLISDGTLRKVQHVKFTFEIWNYEWCSMKAFITDLASSDDADFGNYYMMRNWVDMTAESAMIESVPWAILLIHCLQTWEEKSSALKSLVIEKKKFAIVEDGNLHEQSTLYTVPTNCQELANFKAALFYCYRQDVYFPLTEYLEEFKESTQVPVVAG